MIAPAKTVAILLAAGQSIRFGERDKLLENFDGQPLVLHAAGRLSELQTAQKIAVCRSAAVGDLLRPLGFEIIMNAEPRHGLSRSLSLGIGAAGEGDAALIALGDMPFVSLNHLRALMARLDSETVPVVASNSAEVPMPPAIFARSLFDQLLSGHGDQGARALLSGAAIITAPANELADIDTHDDLARLTQSRAGDPDACRALSDSREP